MRTIERFAGASLLAALLTMFSTAYADSEHDTRFADAASVLTAFTDDDGGIPIDLLARAHGIAVIPKVIRGGFLIGGRRGRGVLAVRGPDGRFGNPALITLTGGSIGWQFGAESADLVLIFANERSVRNIEDGKFTLGGDASAVAGPLGRHNTAALTGRAEVYAYVKSRGLYAGAVFEGARLDVDEQGNERFYAADSRAEALGEAGSATPPAARQFLLVVERAVAVPAPASRSAPPASELEEAQTFPLE